MENVPYALQKNVYSVVAVGCSVLWLLGCFFFFFLRQILRLCSLRLIPLSQGLESVSLLTSPHLSRTHGPARPPLLASFGLLHRSNCGDVICCSDRLFYCSSLTARSAQRLICVLRFGFRLIRSGPCCAAIGPPGHHVAEA